MSNDRSRNGRLRPSPATNVQPGSGRCSRVVFRSTIRGRNRRRDQLSGVPPTSRILESAVTPSSRTNRRIRRARKWRTHRINRLSTGFPQIWVRFATNRNAHPRKGEHSHLPDNTGPCSTRVMFMGESDSTETQPSKPVCDWMIGPPAVPVKSKFRNGRKTLQVTDVEKFTALIQDF